jgi:hypothetical protein
MFHIYNPGDVVPDYNTSDRRLAYIELNARRNTPGKALTRLTADVTPLEPLTKRESFAYQLWKIRKAMHKYYDGGRKHDDMLASIALETNLDKQIKSGRAFLDSHPDYPVKDKKSHAAFLLAEEWRKTWHERKRYSQTKGYDHQVYREMTRKIRDYEAQIDNYIRETIGL